MLTLFQKLLQQNEEEVETTISGGGGVSPNNKQKKVAATESGATESGATLSDEVPPEHADNPDINERLEKEKNQFNQLIHQANKMLNSSGPQDNWLDKFLTHFSNILAANSVNKVGDLKGLKKEIDALKNLDSLRQFTRNEINMLEKKIDALKNDPDKGTELKQCQEWKVQKSAELKETEEDMVKRLDQLGETRAYYARNQHNKGIIGRFFEDFSVRKANLYNNEANSKAGVASTKKTKVMSEYDAVAPGSTAAWTLVKGGATLAATVFKGLYHGDLSNRLKSAFGYQTTPTKIVEEQTKLNQKLAKKNRPNVSPNKPRSP